MFPNKLLLHLPITPPYAIIILILFVCTTFVDSPLENSIPLEVSMKNNKNKTIMACVFAFVILVLMIVIIQVLEMHDSEAYDKRSFVISISAFFGFIVAGIVACVIVGAINTKKVKNLLNAFKNKDYANVVKYKSLCDRLKYNKDIDSLYLTMAISYLELGNTDEFLEYIGKIQGENTVGYKYFWMAVNAVLKNSAERFNFWYAKMNSAPPVEDNYHRMIELIKKRLIDDVELTDEDQAIIDKVHYDTIKNLFTEPINLNMSADNLHNNNDNFDNGNNFFDDGDVDTTTYGDCDSTQSDVNNDNSTLYGDDIEE